MLPEPAHATGDTAAADRVRIARAVYWLENLAAPEAFLAEIGRLEVAGDTALAGALRTSVTGIDLAQQSSLQPFAAIPQGNSAVLYTGRDGPRPRDLLVIFAAKGLRPILPTPVLLQRLSARDWDVLFLFDRKRQHFRCGAGDRGSTFPEVANWIGTVAKRYRRVVSMGTSVGGQAAVWLSLLFPGMRAIAVAARPISDLSRMLRHEPVPPPFFPICACLQRMKRDILYVHGRDHADDGRWATAFAGLSGGSVIPVFGSREHGVLPDLWRAGRLEPFLTAMLNEGAAPDVRDRVHAAVNLPGPVPALAPTGPQS